MKKKAFKRIYTRIDQITKATCTLKAENAGYEELAIVDGRLAQVVKIMGDEVTLQIFAGTEGIPTNAEVIFTGSAPSLKLGPDIEGRFLNAYADQPFNQIMALLALRAEADKIILGGMGLSNDDYLFYKNTFENAGSLERIIAFVNTTEDPPVERLMVPDMALAAAEHYASEHNQKVLVLLTDMTLYADALSIVSNRMDQIPSKDSMPGSLYSDLAKIYEKGCAVPGRGLHNHYCRYNPVRWRYYSCYS